MIDITLPLSYFPLLLSLVFPCFHQVSAEARTSFHRRWLGIGTVEASTNLHRGLDLALQDRSIIRDLHARAR